MRYSTLLNVLSMFRGNDPKNNENDPDKPVEQFLGQVWPLNHSLKRTTISLPLVYVALTARQIG